MDASGLAFAAEKGRRGRGMKTVLTILGFLEKGSHQLEGLGHSISHSLPFASSLGLLPACTIPLGSPFFFGFVGGEGLLALENRSGALASPLKGSSLGFHWSPGEPPSPPQVATS